MSIRCNTILLAACFVALPYSEARTLEFETSEVSTPALSAAPDGRTLIFNLLGHLYRLPVTGGAATQLSFGAYYDSEPVFSPDGARVAFLSNRDGSDNNIFLLELSSGRITQLTHEYQTGTPAWSPDGKTLAYISYLKREEYPLERIPGFGGGDTGSLYTISVQSGSPQRISDPRAFVSVFFLPDGRLAWTIAERAAGPSSPLGPPPLASTTIEVRSAQGTVSRMGALGALPGGVGRVTPTPTGDGFYYAAGGSLHRYTFGDTQSKVVGAFPGQVRLASGADAQVVYAAANAKLWRVSLPGGNREEIKWMARVKMEVAEPLVKKWTPSESAAVQPRAVLTPVLSPDGRTLVFMAAGALWEQPISGGQAKKLVDEAAFQCDPAFSPDGKQVAFISDLHGKREVRVFDFATRQTRTLTAVPGASWALFPSWSSDGKSIVFQRSDQLGAPYRFVRLDSQAGNPVVLGQSGNDWTGRPHFSADGSSLYYTGRTAAIANFFRLPLREGAKPEPVTDLTRHLHDGLVSPDGQWLAFRRNSEIWIGRMEARVMKDADFRRFSGEGGRSFSFTADSSAIVYSEGNKVWRRSVQSGQGAEIPVRLTLPRAIARPLLISRIRVLDLGDGKFNAETSMLIEQGRIRWIGAETGHTVPANALRIDGGGRYAIPGLTDSHTHTAWSNQQITEDSLLAYGVTSVRDTGSRIDLINALLDRGDSTSLPIPRYFASGDIFEGFMPLWGDAFLEITTKEEARDYVRRYKDLGAAFIKAYASLPWYLKTVVAEEAHRLGMPVVGHGLSTEEIVRSIILGFATLEHSGPSSDDIVKLFAASGVKWDPTATIGTGTRTILAEADQNLDAKFRTFIPDDSIRAARPGGTVSDAQRAAWKNSLSVIRRAHDSGVKILDGTDSLMTGIFHGPSVHWELQFFNDADIRAIDVLRIATTGAAEAMGSSASLGTLEPGKLGDVVLLDANPVENIRNTMKIWRVIKGGQVFDPATMR